MCSGYGESVPYNDITCLCIGRLLYVFARVSQTENKNI